jgi:hypothetical protein
VKPIRTLKIFQAGKTPQQVLTNILLLTENTKRHLRGPRYGLRPGTGKIQTTNKDGTPETAICGCGNGLIDMLSKGGRKGAVARETRQLLNATVNSIFNMEEKGVSIRSHATVSDHLGLKAWRRAVKTTLDKLKV